MLHGGASRRDDPTAPPRHFSRSGSSGGGPAHRARRAWLARGLPRAHTGLACGTPRHTPVDDARGCPPGRPAAPPPAGRPRRALLGVGGLGRWRGDWRPGGGGRAQPAGLPVQRPGGPARPPRVGGARHRRPDRLPRAVRTVADRLARTADSVDYLSVEGGKHARLSANPLHLRARRCGVHPETLLSPRCTTSTPTSATALSSTARRGSGTASQGGTTTRWASLASSRTVSTRRGPRRSPRGGSPCQGRRGRVLGRSCS